MGDAKNSYLRVSFDHRVKLQFLGNQIATGAGLLAYRELDETLDARKALAHTSSEVDSRVMAKKCLENHLLLDIGGAQ